MNSILKTLVVSGNRDWRGRCAQEFIVGDCDVHTASTGLDAIDLLRKHVYDIVVVDDGVPGMSAIEFVLNMCDIVRSSPQTAVAGEGLERYDRVWSRCKVSVVGSHGTVADALPNLIQAAHNGARVAGKHADR